MKTNVRFFTYCIDDLTENNPVDILEVSETVWLGLKGAISYERHTMFDNGVNQICLTKEPVDYPDASEFTI